MRDKIFVDTNILIYAHDLDAGPKHREAATIVKKLWEEETGVISTQVLQEFYVNVTRKIAKPLSRAQARGVVKNYFHWHVERNEPDTILIASDIEERHLLSFWDALIIASAHEAKVEKILTEDLTHNQVIEGIRIENPFIQLAPD